MRAQIDHLSNERSASTFSFVTRTERYKWQQYYYFRNFIWSKWIHCHLIIAKSTHTYAHAHASMSYRMTTDVHGTFVSLRKNTFSRWRPFFRTILFHFFPFSSPFDFSFCRRTFYYIYLIVYNGTRLAAITISFFRLSHSLVDCVRNSLKFHHLFGQIQSNFDATLVSCFRLLITEWINVFACVCVSVCVRRQHQINEKQESAKAATKCELFSQVLMLFVAFVAIVRCVHVCEYEFCVYSRD